MAAEGSAGHGYCENRVVSIERITLLGAAGAMEAEHIGGNGSLLRRLRDGWRRMGLDVDLIIVDGKEDSSEGGESVSRVSSLQEASDHLLDRGGGGHHVCVVYLTPAQRLLFAGLRQGLQRHLVLHDWRLVLSDNGWRRRCMFADHAVRSYNGRVFGLSPRIVREASRFSSRAALFFPPVPEELFFLERRRRHRPRIGYVGRIDSGKGSTLLAPLGERLVSCGMNRLAVYGYSWPHRPRSVELFEEVAAAAGVEFHPVSMNQGGAQSDRDLALILSDLDILLLPYRTGSASLDSPALVLEAMAAGVVPIAGAVADLPRIILDAGKVLPVGSDVNTWLSTVEDTSRALPDPAKCRRRARELGVGVDHMGSWLAEAMDNLEGIAAPTRASRALLAVSSQAPPSGHRRRGTTRCALLRALLSAADMAGLRWAFLRNYDGLPERMGSDVDVVVDQWEFAKWAEIVEGEAARNGCSPLRHGTQVGFASYYFSCADGILHVDLFDGARHRGVLYSDGELLDSRERIASGYRLAAGQEGVLLLLHDLLAFRRIRKRYFERIFDLRSTAGRDWYLYLAKIVSPRWANRIDHAVAESRWEALADAARAIELAVLYRCFLSCPPRALSDFVRRVLVGVYRSARRPEGATVVFVGPDGSGKSTVVEVLATRLETLFRPVIIRHSRPGRLPAMRKLAGKLGFSRSRIEQQAPSPAERLESPGMLRVYGNLVYYALDHLLDRPVLSVRRARGALYLYDRFYWDYWVLPGYRRVAGGLVTFLTRLAPKPDLVLLLSCEPRIVVKRKKELDESEVAEQLKRWEHRALQVPIVRLDASASVSEVVDGAVELVEMFMNLREVRRSHFGAGRGSPSRQRLQ